MLLPAEFIFADENSSDKKGFLGRGGSFLRKNILGADDSSSFNNDAEKARERSRKARERAEVLYKKIPEDTSKMPSEKKLKVKEKASKESNKVNVVEEKLKRREKLTSAQNLVSSDSENLSAKREALLSVLDVLSLHNKNLEEYVRNFPVLDSAHELAAMAIVDASDAYLDEMRIKVNTADTKEEISLIAREIGAFRNDEPGMKLKLLMVRTHTDIYEHHLLARARDRHEGFKKILNSYEGTDPRILLYDEYMLEVEALIESTARLMRDVKNTGRDGIISTSELFAAQNAFAAASNNIKQVYVLFGKIAEGINSL